MSWLARSIANSLKFDEDDEDDFDSDRKPEDEHYESPKSQKNDDSSPTTPSRGVKEDLSELSKTLTRPFWGVASFLASPPQPEQKSDADAPESEDDVMLGIKGDFVEIGGKFRSGISRLSNNINVSEITKMASNLLQLESDDEDEESGKRISLDSLRKEAVGVTEEVVAFARDISMHPENWLNFPLSIEDGAGFDMSEVQQGHALAVEWLVPSLAELRLELCPAYMSESSFWKIYFVLLHPRLDSQDVELLSTPQIMGARSLLAHELKNRKITELEGLSANKSSDSEESSVSSHEEPLSMPSHVNSKNTLDNTADHLNDNTSTTQATFEVEKHPAEKNEIEIEDKAIVFVAENNADANQSKDKQVKPSEVNPLGDKDEDEADDWLKEECSEIGEATIAIENNDDVSFSDLEEDDADTSNSLRKSNYSSDKDSRDWVQLGKSSSKSYKDDQESKESNDWLDIDDDIVVT